MQNIPAEGLYLDAGSNMLGKVSAREGEGALVCFGGVLNPRVFQGLCCCQPLCCIGGQQLADEIPCTAQQQRS